MATGFADMKSSTSEEQGRDRFTRLGVSLVQPASLSITGIRNQDIVEFGDTLRGDA